MATNVNSVLHNYVIWKVRGVRFIEGQLETKKFAIFIFGTFAFFPGRKAAKVLIHVDT